MTRLQAAGHPDREFAIEDLFPVDFYVRFVRETYARELASVGVNEIALIGTDQIAKQCTRALGAHDIVFNKSSVAKRIRNALGQMRSVEDLPEFTRSGAESLIRAINDALPS